MSFETEAKDDEEEEGGKKSLNVIWTVNCAHHEIDSQWDFKTGPQNAI